MTDKALVSWIVGFFALSFLFLFLTRVDVESRLEEEKARNQVLTISLEAAELERVKCGCFTIEEIMKAMSPRGEER